MNRWTCFALLVVSASACVAQDRRTVREPKTPAACVTLHPMLALRHGALDASDEAKLDTARLQAALDACGQAKAVELAADGEKNAFLTGPIHIPAGVTLLVDRGVTLMASRDARLYDLEPGSCGVVSDRPEGCKPVIAIDHAPHAAIMGEGAIDGRGGERLLHGDVSWWDLAQQARKGGRQQVPRLIVANGSDDLTLYRITLRNSANFHVVYRGGRGFTVWGVTIDTPRTARNTDGIDPMSAEDITVTHTYIRTGDDNIAIKGTETGVGFMSVLDNHFFHGHGMSIGSETFGGVHDILVKDLSLDGPDNGLRIKSNVARGGVVERVLYRNVCIRDAKNPIVVDTHYNSGESRQDAFPLFRDITLENVRVFEGGQISLVGLDAAHRLSLTLDGVTLDNPAAYKMTASHAAIHYGPGPVNFLLTGEDVSASGAPGKGTAAGCSEQFVPFER